ncbi:hypothetical protein L21SP5_01225 [Salinivirga cyanobacteriivorans]|uniref:Uncharacterized protein n=1 Tax=Salinivirga cyanobacteriivorans TaxID=1307839 RepID=A0A0S2HXS1_9BACT|nr:hypothetical protein [Salinivirga cyanobacteriivorans]ALO14880.1 hypothetical protein L21SP5_01225 [Salinivirga cyanobacteriivorans]
MKKIQFIETPDDFSKMEMNELKGGSCNSMCLILAGNEDKMEKSILKKQNEKSLNGEDDEKRFTLSNLLYAGRGGFCLVFMFDD